MTMVPVVRELIRIQKEVLPGVDMTAWRMSPLRMMMNRRTLTMVSVEVDLD